MTACNNSNTVSSAFLCKGGHLKYGWGRGGVPVAWLAHAEFRQYVDQPPFPAVTESAGTLAHLNAVQSVRSMYQCYKQSSHTNLLKSHA